MSPEDIYTGHILDLAQAVTPDAAPLIGAVVRAGAIHVEEFARGPLLALLATLGDREPPDEPTAGQVAIAAAIADDAPFPLEVFKSLGLHAAALGAQIFCSFIKLPLEDLNTARHGAGAALLH
jgi:hypothetical protein